jgi:hypothetical protein
MNDTTIGLDQAEEAILTCDVADEALERAAWTAKEMGNYTIGNCTGLETCPA